MNFNKEDCLDALSKVHEDTEAYIMIEKLIKEYFGLIEHMKETSLYDVYTYEDNLTKAFTRPIKVIADKNEMLKKEVNDLRKQLGLCKKYKI